MNYKETEHLVDRRERENTKTVQTIQPLYAFCRSLVDYCWNLETFRNAITTLVLYEKLQDSINIFYIFRYK